MEGHLHTIEVAKIRDCTLRGAIWSGEEIISYSDSNCLQIWNPTQMVSSGTLQDRLTNSLRTGVKCGVNHAIVTNWTLYTAN